jgi:phosphatidylglycerol:prolipoprotein diacylglycerol transferase
MGVKHWFTYPNIDPVAIHAGPLAIHWYGLSYLLGFICVYLWMSRPAGRERLGLTNEQIQDFLINALIGVLIGGRAFFVFADILSRHNADYYFLHPINLIAVWQGGMGFFGGLIGVVIAIALFVRRHPGLTFYKLADEVVMMMPIGLFTTRIVNFINDELPGTICNPDHPWCIDFPNWPGPRYPSQLLEGTLDLIAIPILLLVARRRPAAGVLGWTWFTCYGIARSIDEVWRTTDIRFGPLTGAQALSLPMILLGLIMIWHTSRQRSEVLDA